ncbi:hypothetical protein SCHIN_v1c03090 [Spiroplasma chinense]|uniref:Lipoprotein n=1 Tax=Spiroplasma chinense TaxID=216932 RepID=A0A5B9Y4A7_9MOLU|nr:lipoprotein [Spiroplasma chinense]QEH61506.1 hypothetical protein SCHIN_v1c03090 [Spiroplasma chinense]
MKKLLSIIGSIGLLTSTSVIVVACGVDANQPTYVIAPSNHTHYVLVGKTIISDVYVGGYVTDVELVAVSSDEEILKVEIKDTVELKDETEDEPVTVASKKVRLEITGVKIGEASIKLTYGSALEKTLSLKVVAS